MVIPWRSPWNEPRPTGAPPVGRLDWLLVTVVAAAVGVESAVRTDLPGQPWVAVLALVLLPALLWRRERPLVAVLVGWGTAGVLSAVEALTRLEDLGLSSMVVVVVLLYSLVRWGSGHEIVVGSAVVAGIVVLGMLAASVGVQDALGGTAFLLLCAALAAVARYRADLWHRRQREVRNQERVALARDLHDTVAHHVSAIAVQAQAGRVVAESRPGVAAEVLAAIESEASRTLAEMRSMVRVLRADEAVDYAPQPGVADLSALARTDATPAVEVSLAGPLAALPPPVDAAIYRLAQESLTNAVRHARGATRVGIDVRREGEVVRLRVSDDGEGEPGPAAAPGFGLLGMAERAQLLGGSLTAGPAPDGGWVVEATLPAAVLA